MLCPACGSSFRADGGATGAWDAQVSTAQSAPFAAGQTVAHYRITERLGGGGMGVVYRAEDVRLGRAVALKVLPEQYAHDRQALERFQREARAASALNHPHICTLYDIGEHEGQPFLVLELLEGQTLKRRIGGRPLPTDELLELAIQIVDALDAAHAQGVVHRDVKPANVFVTPRGEAMVLDFGLAKLTARRPPASPAPPPEAAADDELLSSPGTVLGTVAYMSPEQARGEDLDARTDLFSLGVVLYEMATGRLPFQGKTPAVLFDAILHGEPAPVLQRNPELPAELGRIIGKALEKDREVRYQGAAELRADLKRLQRDLDSGRARAVSMTATALTVPAQPRRTRRFAGPAAVTVGVLVLGGSAVLHFFPRPAPEAPSPPAGPSAATPPLRPLQLAPFTGNPGAERQPAFSPDGTRIAYVWNGEKGDNFDIYVKLIGAGEPVRLTTNAADDFSPVWRPPDGKWIAFARYDAAKGDGGIYLVPALPGGQERRLAPQSLPVRTQSGPLFGLNCTLAWHPDGNTLVFPSRESATDPVGLFALSVETREKPRRLTTPSPSQSGDILPAFSPDGRTLALVRNRSLVYRMSFPEGQPTQLTFESQPNHALAWTEDGRDLVFASTRRGIAGLWRIPATGGEPAPLAGVGGNANDVAVAPPGQHRLAYVQQQIHRQIWRFRRPGRPEERPTPTPLLVSSRSDGGPIQYSPDGQRITFTSDRSGNEEVYVCDSEGRNPVQLTSFGSAGAGTPRWSPDGQSLAFQHGTAGGKAIFVVGASLDRDQPRLVTSRTFDDREPSWSRDGQSIYFSSNRSGRFEIWKVPAQGGEPVQVTKGGGESCFESADGKLLYYYSARKTRDIWKVALRGGAEEHVLAMPKEGNWRDWALTENGIYFLDPEATPGPAFRFFAFASNEITLIAQLEKNPSERLVCCDVSPNGQWFLYVKSISSSNIMLVENFR
jgi:Tol biopolymer transport system component